MHHKHSTSIIITFRVSVYLLHFMTLSADMCCPCCQKHNYKGFVVGIWEARKWIHERSVLKELIQVFLHVDACTVSHRDVIWITWTVPLGNQSFCWQAHLFCESAIRRALPAWRNCNDGTQTEWQTWALCEIWLLSFCWGKFHVVSTTTGTLISCQNSLELLQKHIKHPVCTSQVITIVMWWQMDLWLFRQTVEIIIAGNTRCTAGRNMLFGFVLKPDAVCGGGGWWGAGVVIIQTTVNNNKQIEKQIHFSQKCSRWCAVLIEVQE